MPVSYNDLVSVMVEKIRLFHIDEVSDGECKTGRVPDGRFGREVFAVRQGAQLYVYENSCPHTGAPLDWTPEQYLNPEKTRIVCANHHALFRIEDGLCVAGPCVGQSLQKVPVETVNGEVFALLAPDQK